MRKYLNNLFSPTKIKKSNTAYINQIKELKKANSFLKKKLIQITKYSRNKLNKVRNSLNKNRDMM